MQTKTTQRNNKKISYTIFGNGFPVMLVHGFGEDDTVWKNQIKFLEKDFQIIIPQLPGTGASELADNTTLESMADALKQIVDTENIKSFVMIGHSMGGYTTLAFAEKYPELLKAFGLFHSSAYADSEEKKATRKKGIEFIKEHGAAAFLKTATPNLFSEVTKKVNPELVKNTVENLPYFSEAALVAYYEAMMQRNDRTKILSNTKVPVLFIIGKYDQAVPFDDSLKQSSLPNTSYINILENAGHMGMLEEAEKSNEVLKEFLIEVLH
jgi:pimeloyl-ACP methyl ester carboxylesterase